jgi:hypothetical protein
MCLEVTVALPRGEKSKVGFKAVAEASGLHVKKYRSDDGRETFHLSHQGGCSCDLLPSKFTWEAPTWYLVPDRLPQLAAAVSKVAAQKPSFSFKAQWLGLDPASPSSQKVTLKSLLGIIRSNGIGNGVEYVVGSA